MPPLKRRRTLLAGGLAVAANSLRLSAQAQPVSRESDVGWYEAAAQMRRLAESWGDQPYGAVLVSNGTIIGWGPSRVVKNRNPNAHAEREAIRDAQERQGREKLPGAVLYSTSRPCSQCEEAAAQAGLARMYFGPSLTDAGVPGQAR